jgi:hypothetical protein
MTVSDVPGIADNVEVRMRVRYVGSVCDDSGVDKNGAVPMKKTFQICGVVFL